MNDPMPVSAEYNPSVLFVSSYHASFDTLPEQIRGITAAFEGTDVKWDMEFMDTKRYPDQENLDHFYALLKHKEDQGLAYDVILIGDDNGLQFFMDHPDLYEGVPKVFFCVNDRERAAKADQLPGVTGILEAISLEDNLNFAKTLFPNATTFTAIVDDSQTGLGDAKGFMAMQETFPDMTFRLINTSTMTFEEAEAVIKAVTKQEILFYLSMFEDKLGRKLTITEASERIVRSAQVPVFRMSIGGLEQGLLGGKMVSYFEQGRQAGEMALTIIAGTSPDDIQYMGESPNAYFFNYEALMRFDINLYLIPKDAILINKPVNFIEENKEILYPAAAMMGILALIVLILIIDNRKQRKLRQEIQANRDEISALYEEITATEEELRYHYDQLKENKEALEASEEKYRILAFTDSLTGLMNRLALAEAMDKKCAEGKAKGILCYVDLDNFKYINDTVGHYQGDQVLIQMGSRLRQLEGIDSFVARLGGDEFVIVCFKQNMSTALGLALAQQYQQLIKEPICYDEREFIMTCSMGVVFFDERVLDTMELLKKADIAMYKSKDEGRDRISMYTNEMASDMSQLLTMQESLRKAVAQEAFVLHYQPQIDLKHQAVCGIESLIRWQKQEGEMVSPGLFIPYAERLGFIVAIGQWVQRETCALAQTCYDKFSRYHDNFRISFNVTSEEISKPEFTEQLQAHLFHYKVNPRHLAIEITESVFMENMADSVAKLHRLRDLGIEIHLDDFGTGYSSLTYLIQLPIDVVKLDRSFIVGMMTNHDQALVVETILRLVHLMGKRVIVEGVETEEQYRLLKEMGCDTIQGYYFAKPMPLASLEQFIQKREWDNK